MGAGSLSPNISKECLWVISNFSTILTWLELTFCQVGYFSKAYIVSRGKKE
jgi:hypothetical protein